MRNPKPCGEKCDVYSRIVGYFRPVNNWNKGKKQEFDDRKMFNLGEERKENNEND
jgi:anaerobic ribonucleoside-triphosphate reductase